MWSMVAQRLTQITPPAATPDQLWQRVEAAWSAVPQEHTQSLFKSMPRRVAAIVRVQYFVRGGSVGHRSRASSKHLSPHLPVDELDSSGVKQGLRCTCRCTCGCRVHKESRLDVDVFEK
ncbi:transposable element Tcb1 transposase [Trichonephila clavipes]|nr:transposable element Tcb1 transposase [Trichonephila clavipes]